MSSSATPNFLAKLSPELLADVFAQCSLTDLIILRKASRSMRQAVDGLAWDVHRFLKQVAGLSDPASFRRMMARSNALIARDGASYFLLGDGPDGCSHDMLPGSVDVFVRKGLHGGWEDHMRQQGFHRIDTLGFSREYDDDPFHSGVVSQYVPFTAPFDQFPTANTISRKFLLL